MTTTRHTPKAAGAVLAPDAAAALFDMTPSTTAVPADAVAGQLRDTSAASDTVAGDGMGWFAALLTPTPPPACVQCQSIHVYRAPAGFVLACPVCFPSEVTA